MKVLTVGDSPLINTGFGRVNSAAVKKMQSIGWEVASIAGLAKKTPEDTLGIKIYPTSYANDVLGVADIERVVDDYRPDIIYMTGDPGSVVAMAMTAPDMPAFTYVPIEGEPIPNQYWRTILKSFPMMTCSQYGVNVIKKELNRDIDYAYHGVDHDVFKVNGLREETRRAMKWDDKFVIMAVSTNVRRKQLPRLIEAVSKLKHQYKQKDIVLYLHTVPFQNHWLDGWNLIEVARMYDVQDIVLFNPLMSEFGKSVPESTGNPTFPGLVELYNAADLFVLPSQVEGFGLPIAEAMACGLPVLVTKYAAGWEVASPAGRGIPVADWEVHKSGTIYANVSVEGMAKEILRLKRDPKSLLKMSLAGIERAKDFNWDSFTEKLIPHMEAAIVTHKERSIEKEALDSAEGNSLKEEKPDREGSASEGKEEG